RRPGGRRLRRRVADHRRVPADRAIVAGRSRGRAGPSDGDDADRGASRDPVHPRLRPDPAWAPRLLPWAGPPGRRARRRARGRRARRGRLGARAGAAADARRPPRGRPVPSGRLVPTRAEASPAAPPRGGAGLYPRLAPAPPPRRLRLELPAIPYYAWANRAAGA